MKVRLPYFLLALLTSTCFFSGSVEANSSPRDVEVDAMAWNESVSGQQLAERHFATLSLFAEAAFPSTYNPTGSKEAGAHAIPAEGASLTISFPAGAVSGNQTICLFSGADRFSGQAIEKVEGTGCWFAILSGPGLYRKQIASFFDIFL